MHTCLRINVFGKKFVSKNFTISLSTERNFVCNLQQMTDVCNESDRRICHEAVLITSQTVTMKTAFTPCSPTTQTP